MTALSFEQVRDGLMTQYGLDAETADRRARAALGELVSPKSMPLPVTREQLTQTRKDGRIIEPWEYGKLEKEIEHACDRDMGALRFDVIRFSHPGKTKQTPGVADRRYYHRGRGLTLWFECKTPDGEQEPAQRAFQEMVEACGEVYVLGGRGDLRAWLVANGVATLSTDGTPIPTPYGA